MINELLHGLNEEQHAAVTAGEGPVLVLAGPGSGKTGVLTRRVAYLIKEMNVQPWHIMAVTFTNKAASEMKHRIYGFLGERVPGLQVGTFHATCARILRIEHGYTNYNQDYVIYDSDDQLSAIRQAMDTLNISHKKFNPRRVLSAISHAKNELIQPQNYVGQDYFTEVVSRIYPRYQEILVDSNAMDFDDLLLQTVFLFQNTPAVREQYQQRYPFILVDEFQDTNMVQYRLVQLLGKPQDNVFAVGDEDQSIYAFRGADYRNVQRFMEDYPQAEIVLLEQNYRSTQIVLDTARAVIDHNSNRTPKRLFTERTDGELISVHEAYNDTYEADYIMESIHHLLETEGYHFSDIAIMYRTNAQSRALETACRTHGVPYHLVGGIGFYQRREIRDMIAYLRVIQNPDDRVSFSRIINVPKRGIGKKSVQDFHNWCLQANMSYGAALEELVQNKPNPLSKRSATLFRGFAEQVNSWRGHLSEGKLVELFDAILSDTGYNLYLSDISDTEDQANDRRENIQELRGFIATYDEDELSLAEFLQDQQLMTDEDRSDEESEQITLLTLHAAKGLEFPVVFITGLEDGLLPHARSFDDPDGLEEERRLFYVGITRAKDRLFLTYAFRRSLYGGYNADAQVISNFLFDIPEELIDTKATSLGAKSQNQRYQKMTTWSSSRQDSGLNRLKNDLEKSKQAEPKESNKKIRKKVIPFPGSQPEKALKYRSGMQIFHPSFGKGTVIESQRLGESEIVTVAFAEKKYGIKKLDAEFADMTIL